jgi:hypothetical protein
MKTLIPVLALALVLAQSPCREAGGVWDQDAG